MGNTLKRLKMNARVQLTPENFDGFLELVDLSRDAEEPRLCGKPRSIELDAVIKVVEKAMEKFDEPVESDAWLAPRVHASLRLFRREAAEPGIWDYLSGVVLRDYVKWRWSGKRETMQPDRIRMSTSSKRIRHAIYRLWWVAELARNGPDYEPVVRAFEWQDTIEWFAVARAVNNRVAAQAYVSFVSGLEGGKRPVGDQIKSVRKAFNHALVTRVLDAIAPDSGPNFTSVERWVNESPDYTLITSKLPEGPQDPKVDATQVEAVETFIKEIASRVQENWEASGDGPARAKKPLF